jgi:hypothetical protein
VLKANCCCLEINFLELLASFVRFGTNSASPLTLPLPRICLTASTTKMSKQDEEHGYAGAVQEKHSIYDHIRPGKKVNPWPSERARWIISCCIVFALLSQWVLLEGKGAFERAFRSWTACSDTIRSCSLASPFGNRCCVEHPAGLMLLTQLWNPGLGPADAWTIHGLWPNHCNGILLVLFTTFA